MKILGRLRRGRTGACRFVIPCLLSTEQGLPPAMQAVAARWFSIARKRGVCRGMPRRQGSLMAIEPLCRIGSGNVR